MDIDKIVSSVRGLNPPQSDLLLLKFRAINQRLDSLLLDHEIYFSPPEKLNDPFDCHHDLMKSLRRAIGRADARHADFLKALMGYESELKNIESASKKAGVCAFSTSLKSPLLWSHYAASGQGCCVIFRFPQQFFISIPDVLGLEDVAYDDSGLSRWLWMDAHRYLREPSSPEFLGKFLPVLQTRLLATKGKHWRYEQETRIIRGKSGSLRIDPVFIAGICFGMETSESDIRRVIRRADQGGLRCSYFRITRDDTNFGLAVEALDGHGVSDKNLELQINGSASDFDFRELIKREMVRASITDYIFS